MKQDKISDQMRANKMIDGTIESMNNGNTLNLAQLSLKITKVCDVSMNYIRKRINLHVAADERLSIDDGVELVKQE